MEEQFGVVNRWYRTSHERELSLPVCNAFRRRLLAEECERRYPTGVALEMRGHPSNPMARDRTPVFVRLEPGEAADRERAAAQRDEQEIDAAVGFRRVVDAISQSKKPVCGHNAALDLCHIYSLFVGPLPDSFDQFASHSLPQLFPCIFDTKYIATRLSAYTNPPTSAGASTGNRADANGAPDSARPADSGVFGSTVLSELVQRLRRAPYDRFAVPLEYPAGFPAPVYDGVTQAASGSVESEDGEVGWPAAADDAHQPSFHQAGYDAYHTGVAFAIMQSAIRSPEFSTVPAPVSDSERADADALQAAGLDRSLWPFVNRLFFMRSGPRGGLCRERHAAPWPLTRRCAGRQTLRR